MIVIVKKPELLDDQVKQINSFMAILKRQTRTHSHVYYSGPTCRTTPQ